MLAVKESMQEASGHLQKMLAGAGLLSKIKRYVKDDLPSAVLFSSLLRDENRILSVPGLDTLLDAFDQKQAGAVMHIKDVVESYSSEAYLKYLESMVSAYQASLQRPLSSDAQFMIVSSEYDAQHGALATDGDGTMHFKLAQPSLDGVLLGSKSTCSELLMSVRTDYPEAKVVHVIDYLQSQLNDLQVQLDHVRAPSHEVALEGAPARKPAVFSQLDIDIHVASTLILSACNELLDHGFTVVAPAPGIPLELSRDPVSILDQAFKWDAVEFSVFSDYAGANPKSHGVLGFYHKGDPTEVISQIGPELEPFLVNTLAVVRAHAEGRYLEYCQLADELGVYCDYSLSTPGMMAIDLNEGRPDLSSARPFIEDEIGIADSAQIKQALAQWLPSQPGGLVVLESLGIEPAAGKFERAASARTFIVPESEPALQATMW